MRRLLLLIAGILILTAVAVPSAAVYYFAFTEAGLQYLFSRIPHKAAGVGLEFIGIHGTDRPELIPGRISHGCIRMRNADILALAKLMPIGTPLTIG